MKIPLNTSGGTILVGYDDDGKLVGIEDAKKCEEALSNQLEKCIEPDCRVFVSVNAKQIEDKEILDVKVIGAPDIFYLTEKGIKKDVMFEQGLVLFRQVKKLSNSYL